MLSNVYKFKASTKLQKQLDGKEEEIFKVVNSKISEKKICNNF